MIVRGLLLISHRGDRYFIEGGIKANKVPNPQIDDAITTSVTKWLDESKTWKAAFQSFVEMVQTWREGWMKDYPPSPNGSVENVGPVFLQAYNVEVERPDFGDAAITGNSTNLDLL